MCYEDLDERFSLSLCSPSYFCCLGFDDLTSCSVSLTCSSPSYSIVQKQCKSISTNFLAFPGFSTKFRSPRNCDDKSPKFRDTYCFIPRESSRDNSRCSIFRSELSSDNSRRSKFRGNFSSEFSFCLSILQHFWAMFCCIRNSTGYKPSLWCGCARKKQL